jgi:hypothetical protein
LQNQLNALRQSEGGRELAKVLDQVLIAFDSVALGKSGSVKNILNAMAALNDRGIERYPGLVDLVARIRSEAYAPTKGERIHLAVALGGMSSMSLDAEQRRVEDPGNKGSDEAKNAESDAIDSSIEAVRLSSDAALGGLIREATPIRSTGPSELPRSLDPALKRSLGETLSVLRSGDPKRLAAKIDEKRQLPMVGALLEPYPGVSRLAHQVLKQGYTPTKAEQLKMIAALGGMQVEIVAGRIRFDTTAEVMSRAEANAKGKKPIDLSQEKADLMQSMGVLIETMRSALAKL